MARRVVQECDLTKQEYDPEETVTLIIKRSGKKTGRTYELSSDAASKLEAQLVSGNKLDTNWGFGRGAASERTDPARGRTLADLDTDQDDKTEDASFVAKKKRELTEEGVDTAPRERQEDDATVLPGLASNSDCLHMNKGAIQITMVKGGERQFYRICKSCRGRVPEKAKGERSAYLGTKAPADSRVGESSVAKERNK